MCAKVGDMNTTQLKELTDMYSRLTASDLRWFYDMHLEHFHQTAKALDSVTDETVINILITDMLNISYKIVAIDNMLTERENRPVSQ